MMKKILMAVGLLWFGVSHSLAEQVIELRQGEKVLYLFGTVHIAKPEFYPLDTSIVSRLQASEAVALELNINDEAEMIELVEIMMTEGLDSNRTLSDWMPPETIDGLVAALGEEPVNRMKNLRPWMLVVQLINYQAIMGGFTELGVDIKIADLAGEYEIPVIGLETVRYQMNLMQNLPESEVITMANQFANQAELKKQLESMIKVYDGGQEAYNIADKMIKQMKEETPVFYETFLVKRDREMTESIISLNQSNNPLFVAVGAAHIYGPNGIVKALLAQGYEMQ